MGGSGLKVSRICLGAGTFGSQWGTRWSMSPQQCEALIALAVDAGVSFIDTASVYNKGESELWLGEILERRGIRDAVVLSTKFGYATDPHNANSGGAGRRAMFASVDRSLRRLRTDYLDILYLHIWDGVTDVEHTMSAAADLIAAGKIRHFGLSNVPGWYFGQAAMWSGLRREPILAAVQMHYNLLERSVESELMPCAQQRGVGFVAWGPLANGLLTGKYEIDTATGEIAGQGRVTETFTTGDIDPFGGRARDIVRRVSELARELGCAAAELSLAWLLSKPDVCAVAIGVSAREQLEANLRSVHVTLPAEVITELDDLSRPPVRYPHTFLRDEIQALVHGDRKVETA